MHLKVLPARNYEELVKLYRFATSIMSPDEILVQEIIPGNGQTQYSVATY